MKSSRLLTVAICALLSAGAAQTADKPAASATQLPRQVLPTGAEDAQAAAAAAAPAARFAVSAASETELLDAELLNITSESDEGLVEVTLPDGSTMVDLEGRFQSVAMATKTAEGDTTVGCFTGKDALEHAHLAREIVTAQAATKDAKQQTPKLLTAPKALEEK